MPPSSALLGVPIKRSWAHNVSERARGDGRRYGTRVKWGCIGSERG